MAKGLSRAAARPLILIAVLFSLVTFLNYHFSISATSERAKLRPGIPETSHHVARYGESSARGKTTAESQKSSPGDRIKVDRKGHSPRTFTLRGMLVDQKNSEEITAQITTEVVFAFSPTAEEQFRAKIVDPIDEQIIFANSPAITWHGDRFLVVMRMWLDKEESNKIVQNIIADNYFYAATFNSKMEALDDHGRVLGIPTRVHKDLGDGPIEPRAFWHYDRLYLSFNSGIKINGSLFDTTFFWDYDEEQVVMPKIREGQPTLQTSHASVPRDKHWSPYTYKDQLYFIYSLDPLRILLCDRDSKCYFTRKEGGDNYEFHQVADSLRGGTPTVHYKDEFYITIAHSTMFRKDDWKRVYTINLAVLKITNDNHRIVFLSSPILFNETFMSSIPMVRHRYIRDDFVFPVSLLVEDADNIIIGGHVNDHSSYLFRVTGIQSLMDDVMVGSKKLSDVGPQPGKLHNLTKEFSSQLFGYTFYTD